MNMSELYEIWERPTSARYMIAGWQQWADAGAVSSGLPLYLLEQTQAAKIAEIHPDGFYLFQVPGTHDLFRPMVKLQEGHRESMEEKLNEFFFAGDDEHGFYIFLGEEPHLNEERYADAFFDVVEELGIERVAAVAGVYGAMPYEKEREVSSVYSHPSMKDELQKYAVRFSSYEGGATISMYLADRAERRGIEFFRFCAFVPSYDFSKAGMSVQPIAISEDHKAWYDLMARLDYMFGLEFDLSDLQRKSEELMAEWDVKIAQVAESMPHLAVKEYMEKLRDEFKEMPFEPLSDLWTDELKGLLGDL